jgi:ParB-like chromosome segregation protein Spo0J
MNKTAWRQPTNRVRRAPHTGLRSVVAYLPLESIVPDSSNPRKHSPEQVRAIARSIEAFGFNAPILVDKANRVVAGHGRLEAAKRLNFAETPVIRLEHLSEQQAKAYMLANNKLTDRSSWDDRKVAIVPA